MSGNIKVNIDNLTPPLAHYEYQENIVNFRLC